MVKAELGQKRVCISCAAKFYDLSKSPIICPKCGKEFDASAVVKPRRVRAAAEDKAAKGKKVAKVVEAELPEAEVEAADDEEEESVIEDASELGEDEDDMAEVIENVDEDHER